MLDVVVGGMYGSEAKGHVTQRLVERRLREGLNPVWNIRIGGPNAGHTGHDGVGVPWAFRQVPVGVLCAGEVHLEIGAGSEIDLPVLLDEIDRCEAAGLMAYKELYIHGEATLITDEHKAAEGGLVSSIGSTGKGIGAARADRLMRKASRLIDDAYACQALRSRGALLVTGDDGEWRPSRADVVIEGTQGYALGLRAGYYPQCTTSDCRAIDFLSMAGISPWDPRYGGALVWVVARVYPIRVAGNSGPMQNETSWERLDLPIERTTVTQKIRRVGLPDWDLVRRAIRANGTDVQVALSMVDQAHPEIANVPWSAGGTRWDAAEASIRTIEAEIGAPISMVLSGPNTASFRNFI